ncbi:hypothetical protein QE357_001613 [Siphonobacter sp. BAB-5404]|nr:hypothetical protein [Siphonobacter sp. SORGH_AS_0500]
MFVTGFIVISLSVLSDLQSESDWLGIYNSIYGSQIDTEQCSISLSISTISLFSSLVTFSVENIFLNLP